MSPAKRIGAKTKEFRQKVREFREEARKPKEPITTKASLFSIVSWAFYDLGNTIFSILIVSFYFSLWVISDEIGGCLLYTSPSPRDLSTSRMPSSA